LIPTVLGGLVLIGGTYYLGNKNLAGVSNSAGKDAATTPLTSSNSNSLSRESAAEMIMNNMKQQPATVELDQAGVITCPNGYHGYNNVLNALQNGGFISQKMFLWSVTAKATPYVIATGDSTFLLVAQVANVVVTGIAKTTQNTAEADFTETSNNITPFGVACSYPATQNGVAELELYDDGWRVVSIKMQNN
jgi:hypothetical protein